MLKYLDLILRAAAEPQMDLNRVVMQSVVTVWRMCWKGATLKTGTNKERIVLISSGGLNSGAGSSNGANEREKAKVRLKEEPCPLRIYLKNIYFIINGFQEEPNTSLMRNKLLTNNVLSENIFFQ